MLDTICDVMKATYDKKWISTRDGNASFKRKGDNPKWCKEVPLN